MREDEIIPVRHTTTSALGATAGSMASQGVRTGVRSALYWVAGLTAVGAVLGAMIATAAWVPLVAGLVGGLVGISTIGFPAMLGGLFGAGRGFQEGRQRVAMERGAAQMIDMEFANAQMQMLAAAQQQPRQTGTAAAGSRYNQAASTVDAGSLAREGMLAQQQLQRA
jgi:hypothetical protein